MSDKKKKMYVSASAIDCADPVEDGCYRKWLGEKVLKLPRPATAPQTFGDVLHEVVERWISADLNGMKDGKPVDLYPPGWERPVSKIDGEKSTECVTPEEQAIIKLLVAKAIETGMVYRSPDFELEKPIKWWEIMDGIIVNGFIDLLEPDAIVDHKSTKDMKWAKSKNKRAKGYLGKNIQLMLYAYWYYTKKGYPKGQPVRLRHNYFCKNIKKPHVEAREIWTTWEDVNLFWTSRIHPVLENMKALYERYLQLVERGESEHDIFTGVPLPPDTDRACRRFKECQFIKICNGFETVSDYKRRLGAAVDKADEEYSEMVEQQTQGEGTMSNDVMEKLKRLREAKAGGKAVQDKSPAVQKKQAPATETVTATAQAPVVEAKPEAADGAVAAPWHQPGCASCAGSRVPGFRKDESGPCAMCKMMSNKKGGPVPDDFEYDITEGQIMFIDKKTGEEVACQIVAEQATSKTPEPEAPPARTKASIKEAPALPPKPEEAAAQEPAAKLPPEERTIFMDVALATEREKFELFIECAIVESKTKGGGKIGSPSNVITGEELHQMVIVELSGLIDKGNGPAGWYGIDVWTRRDAIMMYGRQIAEMLGSSSVQIGRLSRASELETIITAIRPYSKRVVQALQG